MNQTNLIKKVGTIILSSVMTSSMVVAPIFAAEKDDNPTEKTETIYGVLESDGSLSSQIVSNWIHDEDGITNIKETLNLTNVENVKTDEEPSVKGNEYTWNVEGNDVYYQGDSDEQMPVSIRLEYELDGKKVKAEDLKNVSGHLKITAHFTNASGKTIQTGGKNVKIHPFYVAGGIINFETKNASNIKCSSGKILNDASKSIVAFVSLPGLAETFETANLQKVNDKLKISDDCVIEADVKKYSLGSMMFGISNEMNINNFTDTLDITSYTGSLAELFDGADQLLDGSKQLAEGTQELQEKALPLTNSQDSIETLIAAALKLDDGANQINTGATQLNAGANQLSTGANQLNAGVQQYLAGASQVNSGLTQLNQALTTKDETYGINFLDLSRSVADGSTTLKDSVDGFVSGEQFKQLQGVLTTSKSELDSMSTNLATAKATLSGLESALGPVSSSMEELSGALQLLSKTATNVQTKLNDNATSNNAIVESDNAIIAQYNQATTNALSALDAAIAAAQASEDESVRATAETLSVQRAAIAQVGSLQELSTVDVSTELAQLSAIVEGITTKVSDMEGTIAQAKGAISSLEGVLSSSQESVTTLENNLAGAQAGMSSMSQSLSSLQTGVHQLWVGTVNLNKAINGYVDEQQVAHAGISQAVDTLKKGTDTLVANNEAIKEGASQLAQGTSDLAQGSSDLAQGTSQLAQGTSQLASNKEKLQEMSDGLATLGDALVTLKEGAQTLYQGEQTFETEGMGALKELADLAETDIETLKDIFNAAKSMRPESYSGSPKGSTVKTRFIIHTNAIE